MATSQKKRQKKLEQKKAKRKQKRTAIARRKQGGFAARLAMGDPPVIDCIIGGELEKGGMASVLVSRRLPDGAIAWAMFLVDSYFLGIKDSYTNIDSPGDYSDRLDDWIRKQSDHSAPADARKLIEEAAEYGRSNGSPPRGNYRKAFAIFTGIDAADATRTFEFGKDGKPMYISGPFDSPGMFLGGAGELALIDDDDLDDDDFDDDVVTIYLDYLE